MQRQANPSARLLAVLALVGAALALTVVVSSSSTGGDDDSGTVTRAKEGKSQKQKRSQAATYVVKSGDTLTAISHKTGIPVTEIIALNPEIDPQILIAGQTLKLR